MLEFLQYMPEVFTLTNFTILVVGTVGGLILGSTPGLSPTMAVALLIPFTFHMETAASLILLGSVYTSTVAGGAVSAILINIPGAPANIATILDGHPMANSGRATEALHYCFISSLVGGVFGIGILIFFTPVLAEFALGFGPAELMWIAIMGVTVIGSLGSKSVLKGLIAGALGLWLAAVGDDPVLGEERFIFFDPLTGGIGIVPALIGLFSIPQVLTLLEDSKTATPGEFRAMEEHSIFDSLAKNLGSVKALALGSSAGAFIGLIPGAGGQIAGLIAYDQCKKWSSHPETFGKGEKEGIIAAESANNAMVGPSLVPLLTLAVPGSPTAAVLLGGLLIHGLFPGPDLFTKHAAVTWTFIDSMLVGQFMMAIFGLSISKYSRFVTRIPNHFMASAVMILTIFGTYSVGNSFADVLVMLGLGTSMYFLSKVGFNAAPVVLGIILGKIAEENYLQGEIIADAGDGKFDFFFTGTVNVVLISFCVASIAYSIFAEIKNQKMSKQEAA